MNLGDNLGLLMRKMKYIIQRRRLVEDMQKFNSLQYGFTLYNSLGYLDETTSLTRADNTYSYHFCMRKKYRGPIKKITFRPGFIGVLIKANVIAKIVPYSSALSAGVRPGWTILEINGKKQCDDYMKVSKNLKEAQTSGKETVILFLMGIYREKKTHVLNGGNN